MPGYDSIVVQVHPNSLVHNAIYYNTERLELLDDGRFWLAEVPGAAFTATGAWPRPIVWGLFQPNGNDQTFYVLNTHLRGGAAAQPDRLVATQVTKQFGATLDPHVPVVLLRGFNAVAGSAEHRDLTGGSEPMFFDSRQVAAIRTSPEGTFHGFRGQVGTRRIDWILFRGAMQPLDLHHITMHEGDRYPTDHLPVFATLRLW